MNICIVGPSRSGKSALAHYLAIQSHMPVVDTGQVVRLTATKEDQVRLQAGGLSVRERRD